MSPAYKEKTRAFLKKMVAPGDLMIAAVSGGADSMAMLDLLLCVQDEIGYRLEVAHIHHHLRSASDAEWLFVEEYCRQRQVTFHGCHVQVQCEKRSGESLEAAAHRLRHKALREVVQERGAQWLALAHHADDRAETVLMNILRGCSIKGLSAMPACDGILLRPLLGFSKAELEQYCEAQQISYVSDESNADTTILRNRLRHELLPELSTYNPQVVTALNRLAESSEEVAAYLQDSAHALYQNAVDMEGGQWVLLKRQLLCDATDAVLGELVRGLSQRLAGNRGSLRHEMVTAFLERLRTGDGHCDFGQGIFCECTRRWVYIGYQPEGQWQQIDGGWRHNFLAAEITGTLTDVVVRTYKSDDAIALKNLGNKRLKKVFQEAALPPCLRHVWPIVYDTKIKEIIWVPFLAQSRKLMYYNSVTYLKVAFYCKMAQKSTNLAIDQNM